MEKFRLNLRIHYGVDSSYLPTKNIKPRIQTYFKEILGEKKFNEIISYDLAVSGSIDDLIEKLVSIPNKAAIMFFNSLTKLIKNNFTYQVFLNLSNSEKKVFEAYLINKFYRMRNDLQILGNDLVEQYLRKVYKIDYDHNIYLYCIDVISTNKASENNVRDLLKLYYDISNKMVEYKKNCTIL